MSREVLPKGDKFVVERHGEPVAVVVPLEVYEQWKRNREALFQTIQQSQQRANLSEAEAGQFASEAVEAVHSDRNAAAEAHSSHCQTTEQGCSS